MKLVKKLMLLIVLMMMSWKSFSQNVIDSTSIQLKKPVAKLVIKDLITGDGAKNELALTLDKIVHCCCSLLFIVSHWCLI